MQEIKIIHRSKSWKDLDRTIKKLIKHKKAKLAGSIFEHLTKLFLEVSPEYKTKLSKVYLLNEVPNNLKKKLKLPNTDEGIDLIAETFDKEYWAIQCKYRSNNTETLKVKGDLATFNNLAFTVCKNISHGIVCTTVNRPPKKTKLLNSIGFELLTTWLGLDRNDGELFKEIKSKAIGKIKRPKKLYPKPHQVKAINRTIDYFKSNERGKMIMPCGTGKSLTAFWIAEKMKPKSILVAVPSLALLQQTLKVWTREFLLNNIEPDWLCVCSDDTVKDEQDDFVTSSSDLGIKVDTDPRVIRNFLKKKTSKLKIVFSTYQSGRATAIGSKGFSYDLGIMDEAHKTVGSKSKEMAHLLHQKNIKIDKRLFMTATERLFRGDSDDYMSMDNQSDYGDLIYELSFKEAINSKPPIISDYKIITFGFTNPEIESITQDNKYLQIKKELKDITARELATALALRKAIKKLKIKNAISFHRSIKRADNFRKQQDLITKIYPDYGKLKTFHVKGDMPTSDRALEMLAFEEEQGLMTNARCLTEGVDLPAIDCVCFTDPKRSKIDIVQAAGRALRLAKGKKFGYILIPIFIPDGMDFDEAAEEQGFDDVSVTVRALATTDKRIIEYLRAISEGKKPKGGTPVDGVTSINQLYKVEAEEFNKAVKIKLWDKLAISIKQSYIEARKIVNHLKIKSGNHYRKFYNQNKLPADLPASPEVYYKNKGWTTWGEFLSTGRIADQLKEFIELNDLKKIVRKLKIKNSNEYVKKYKKIRHNKQIPYAPNTTYKNKGWVNWANFLGTNKLQKIDYWSFKKSKKYIKKFNLRNQSDWYKFCKNNKPINIPSHPHIIYKNKGFKDLGHFIGSNNIANKNRFKNYLSYEEAKKFLRKSKITTQNQFKKYIKEKNLSLKIPYNPNSVYKKKGWKGFGDFLSTNRIADQNKHKLWWSEEKIKKFLKLNKIKNSSDWRQFCSEGKKPQFIPNKISKAFKKDKKISDIFINSQPRGKWVSFKKAKKLISNFNLKTNKDFFKMIKNNKVISNQLSKTPQVVYKNAGWNGWTDFLGNK
jgi:superfamily II DNA or RNA helicase